MALRSSRVRGRGAGLAPLAGALLALALLLPAAAPADELRIGYVEMARLIDSAPQMIAGKEALQREFAARDVELTAQEQRVEEMERQFRREGDLLPRQVAEARSFEIETARRNLTRLRERMREDLDARRKEELNKRWPEIEDGIIEFARANDYDLIVQSPVLYAAPALDVTDQVLEFLRRNGGSGARQP